MGELMKAAVYHGVRDMRVQDVPKPVAGPGEVVVRVRRCSVCGTDKRIFVYGQKNVVPPVITGHEIVGTVYELGVGVDIGVDIGQAISVAAIVGCGQCLYCRRQQINLCDHLTAVGYDYAGGFAEFLKVPAAAVAQGNVVPLPASLPVDRAALIEPLSCCLNGQEYLSPQPGERAVVFGAGPIGLMHAGLLKARGCSPVVVAELSPERLGYIAEFGLGVPVDTSQGGAPEKILAAAGGEKFDIAITACSSKQAQADALKVVRKRARVSFFAGVPKDDPILPVDSNLIHYHEISVFGCFGSNLQHFRDAVTLISGNTLPWDRFLTHRFKLRDMLQAYAVIEAGRGIKSIIDCDSP